MSVQAFRLLNFMAFEDSSWIALRPINLLFGRNATGKSVILRALLLLRQSLTSPPSGEPLTLFADDGIDAGSFQHIVYRKSASRTDKADDEKNDTMIFEFKCRIKPELLESFQSEERRLKAQAAGEPVIGDEAAWATLLLAFGPRRAKRHIILQSIEIHAPWLNTNEDDADTLIFAAEWGESDVIKGRWVLTPSIVEQRWNPTDENPLGKISDFGIGVGFLPLLPELEEGSPQYASAQETTITQKVETQRYIQSELAHFLARYFNDEELRTLCFDMRVPFANLLGQANLDKARSLIAHLERHARIGELVEVLSRYRPKAWERGLETILERPETSPSDLPGTSPEGKKPESDYEIVRKLLDEFRSAISDFLRSLHYLGPTRSEPRRFYYAPAAMSDRTNVGGVNALENLLVTWGTDQWGDDLGHVNNRLTELDLKIQLDVRPLDEERKPHESIFEVLLQEQDGIEASICDTGYGWSQMLPIVIECALAEEGATILIEQPELHLHPKHQAELGDLFIRLANQGARFLIETHSENLLLRLRRRLAETSGGMAKTSDLSLKHENFRAYFVDRQKGVSSIEALEFDEWGDYTYRPPRFGDFFGQDFEELVKMKKARSGHA